MESSCGRLAALKGHYLYGCYVTKRVWAVSYVDGEVGEPFVVADARGPVVSFAETGDGGVMVVNHDGKVWRLRERVVEGEPKPWPAI